MTDERGWAVVTAIMVISVMTMFALTTLTMVDNQSRSSGKSRVQETSYNVAEAALSNEVFNLARGKRWPGTAANAYQASCTRADTTNACPNGTEMANGFTGTDFNSSTDWNVTIRDNLGTATDYYQRSVLDSASCTGPVGLMTPCTWDSNKDGRVWVRASANVRNQQRTLVALVQQTQVPIPIPKRSVVAGRFSTTNQGKKVIVDTLGCAAVGASPGACKAAEAGGVAVRCNSFANGKSGPVRGGSCLGWDPAKGQVSPNVWEDNYVGNAGGCNTPNCVLTSTNLADLRRVAQANGTYTQSGCPASLTGAVVFVEDANTSCSYTGGTWNSATSPGVLIVNKGTLSLGGNITYFGLIYAANAQNSTGAVVTLGGAATVQGSIMIEGNGALSAGSSKYNIIYDPSAIENVIGYSSSPAIVQNTFRELPGSQ